jgi:hypothetical protein
MTSKNIILEPNYTRGYNKGKKDERQRMREKIREKLIDVETLLCDCDEEDMTEEYGQHSSKCIYIIFRDEVLALLSEEEK